MHGRMLLAFMSVEADQGLVQVAPAVTTYLSPEISWKTAGEV